MMNTRRSPDQVEAAVTAELSRLGLCDWAQERRRQLYDAETPTGGSFLRDMFGRHRKPNKEDFAAGFLAGLLAAHCWSAFNSSLPFEYRWCVADLDRAWALMHQAEADLKHASAARDGGSYPWSAFAAQQAAEKALKSVLVGLSVESESNESNELSALIAELPDGARPGADLVERARQLSKHTWLAATQVRSPSQAPLPASMPWTERARQSQAQRR